MRQIRSLLGASLVSVLAFGALGVAFASAEESKPNMLVAGGTTAGATFKDSSGESRFEGEGLLGKSVAQCAASSSKGVFVTEKRGTFALMFGRCLTKILTTLLLCTGLDALANSSAFSMLGTFQLRYRNSAKAAVVVALLLSPVHFTCVSGAIELLYVLRGCVAGLLTPTNKKVKATERFQASFKEAGAKNEVTKIENEAGTGEESCVLEVSEGGGTFKQDGMESSDEIEVSKEAELMA